MILRRLTRHVEDQNWFAVALDFLIVVVGVYLGIALGDWNDLRKEAAEEAALTAQLREDFEAQIDLLQSRQARAVAQYTATRTLALSVEANTLPADDDATLSLAETAFRSYAIAPAAPMALAGLVGSGELADLDNDSLRRALIAYQQANDATVRIAELGIAADLVFGTGGTLASAVRYSTGADYAEDFVLVSYDADILRAAGTELFLLQTEQSAMALYLQWEAEAAEAVLAVIDETSP